MPIRAATIPFYLGHADETGEGEGLGYNMNLPLARGATSANGSRRWRRPASRWHVRAAGAGGVARRGRFPGDPLSPSLPSADFLRVGERIGYLELPTVFVLEGGMNDAAHAGSRHQRGQRARRKKPASAAIVSVDHAGTVRRLATNNLKNAAAITDAPPADARFWRDTPTQSLTITDMKFYQDKLYVAGLSNRSFASTLRVYDYPFAGAVRAATVEMYHPVHNQIETRAPIRAMSIMTLNGEPTLVAAYTCTPLVTMPLSAIRDGAHIVAKTIGEMGWGSAPVGLVTFKVDNTDYALLANSSRSADLLALNQIAEGATQPGLSTPIKWPSEPYLGVKAAMIPMAATMRVDNLNDKLLLAMRRDDASGRMQLYSLPKGAYLRISDFVNEYDFKEYVYPKDDPFREFHKYARGIEGYPELAR
jgi:hypothetical protein